MSNRLSATIALGCSALWLCSAHAQSTSIHTNPDGSLSGSVNVPGAPPVSVQAGNGQATSTPWGGGPGSRPATGRSPDSSSSTTVTAGPNGQAWTSGGGGYSCPNGAAVTVTSGPDGTTSSCGGAAQGVWASAGDGQARSGVIPQGGAYAPRGVSYRDPARIERQVDHRTRVRHVGRAHHHRRHRT